MFVILKKSVVMKSLKLIFFELVRILKHNQGVTIAVIMNELRKIGYYAGYRILNAKDYGNVPQNRERIYIVAFRDEKAFMKFRWPNSVPLTNHITDVIDFRGRVDERYYYRNEKFQGDIYDKLQLIMLDDNIDSPSVYQ